MADRDHVLVAGMFFGLCAAAVYWSGNLDGSEVNALTSARRINHLEDLAQISYGWRKDSALIVVVCGRVGSSTPINYEHTGVQVVIVKETAAPSLLLRGESFDWVPVPAASTVITYKEVPWYLDDGTSRVHVVGAKNADGVVLEVAKSTFDESGFTYKELERLKNQLSYEKKDYLVLGVTITESILPTGKYLTVVGEVVNANGIISIRRPEKGPFYVSQNSIDQMIVDLRKSTRFYKFVFAGLTLLSVVILIAGARK